ncbi:MAG: NADH-quinone oxidoreductase subunit J [Proteobacteria bacterium]|nr:NADH-quinone oxidoreductase subunit J [Pseudomonadota bacterium]MBU1685990.1 NADH-quinone oxidoreductase subunit J [Pseudomonadota bacterium]
MSSLVSVEGLAGVVFLVVVAVTLIGGVIATSSTRLPRAVSGLALCLIGIAGLYYFLNSPFLAAMEMLIYVGAVCVTIVFAIMLADPGADKKPGGMTAVGTAGSLGVGALFAWGLAALGTTTMWPAAAVKVNDGSVKAVGHALLTTYSFVFELISVVLLLAIIGALALARSGRDKA